MSVTRKPPSTGTEICDNKAMEGLEGTEPPSVWLPSGEGAGLRKGGGWEVFTFTITFASPATMSLYCSRHFKTRGMVGGARTTVLGASSLPRDLKT